MNKQSIPKQKDTMPAMLANSYGPPHVLSFAEHPKPEISGKEILIEIKHATVTAGDCELRSFKVAGWVWLPLRLIVGIRKPRNPILGQEFAGVVEAIGKNVDIYKVGDRVFGSTGIHFGTYAAYRAHPLSHPLGHIPHNVNFDQAATIPTGGINALHFFRKAHIKAGESLLINGAGGSIGTYCLQLAKMAGAKVSCVDSAIKFEMLKELGADQVIDYQKEDFTKRKETYHAIIDIVGSSHYGRSLACLKPGGRYVQGNPRVPGMLRSLWTNLTQNKRVIIALAGEKMEDLNYLANLIGKGKLKPPMDKRFTLKNLVEAHEYVEAGHKKGNVIIDM